MDKVTVGLFKVELLMEMEDMQEFSLQDAVSKLKKFDPVDIENALGILSKKPDIVFKKNIKGNFEYPKDKADKSQDRDHENHLHATANSIVKNHERMPHKVSMKRAHGGKPKKT